MIIGGVSRFLTKDAFSSGYFGGAMFVGFCTMIAVSLLISDRAKKIGDSPAVHVLIYVIGGLIGYGAITSGSSSAFTIYLIVFLVLILQLFVYLPFKPSVVFLFKEVKKLIKK